MLRESPFTNFVKTKKLASGEPPATPPILTGCYLLLTSTCLLKKVMHLLTKVGTHNEFER